MAPERPWGLDERAERLPHDERPKRLDGRRDDLGSPTYREGQPVPFDAVAAVRLQYHIGSGVIRVRVHRIGTVE
jgi:hypothetical protein